MVLEQVIDKIDRYIYSTRCTPVIVDAPSVSILQSLRLHYNVGDNVFMCVDSFCNNDQLIRLESFENELSHTRGICFIYGLSTWLKLLGEEMMRKHLRSILEIQTQGHCIILTYQCKKYLDFKDPRLLASSRIVFTDGVFDEIPEITLTTKEMVAISGDSASVGINCIGEKVEGLGEKSIRIITSKKKNSFRRSMLPIKEERSLFELIGTYKNGLTNCSEQNGTEERWMWLINNLTKKTWDQLLIENFGGEANLDFAINGFSAFNKEQKWLFYIALRQRLPSQLSYVRRAAISAETYNGFIRNLYRLILEEHPQDKAFYDNYIQRKNALKQIGEQPGELTSFLSILSSKEKDAIHYLTDITRQEKENIITLLSKYGDEYKHEDLDKILRIVYPELSDYLKPYYFSIPLLDTYFSEYKQCKLLNKISPDFEKMMTEQAERREYNSLLQPRSSYLDQVANTGGLVYFVDALGVEYLSYIIALCEECNLSTRITVCRSELPSLTSFNKEFIDVFESHNCNIVDIKELDEIKHHGKENYDYQKTKTPLHLIRELEIIKELLLKIRVKIETGTIEKAILISDHGASRLSVIHETENIWEMETKGEHCGRCCRVGEIGEKPLFATEENGYWVLANYDRFRGGRKACVEVHGGATLEEVTVPIIEITKSDSSIECFVLDEYKRVPASFKTKAAIKLYIGKSLSNVTVLVDGKSYSATALNENHYFVEFTDLRKPKVYHFELFADGQRIASDLSFSIYREGSTEKDLL